MDIFNPYKNIKDKFESNFTIIIYDYSIAEVIKKIQHHLGLINLITDNFKRSYLYNRLNEFKNYITNRYINDCCITEIFLVGKEIYCFNFVNDWHNIIQKFDIDHFIFIRSEYFDIDFLTNLLTDSNFYNVITISKNKFIHYHYNKSKRKIIYQNKWQVSTMIEYLQNLNEVCIIHGTFGLLTNTKSNSIFEKHIIIDKLLHEDEIFDIFERKENKKNEIELTQWLSKLLHPVDGKRLVFGKDIQTKIRDQQIQILFCSPEMTLKVNERIPDNLKNYKLIIVKSYDEDDPGYILKKNYNGIIGITYF